MNNIYPRTFCIICGADIFTEFAAGADLICQQCQDKFTTAFSIDPCKHCSDTKCVYNPDFEDYEDDDEDLDICSCDYCDGCCEPDDDPMLSEEEFYKVFEALEVIMGRDTLVGFLNYAIDNSI